MKVNIYTDIDHVLKSLSEVVDFADELRQKGMYVYFPFSAEKIKSGIFPIKDIEADMSDGDSVSRIKEFESRIHPLLTEASPRIKDYCDVNRYDYAEQYNCILTPYGPYGYYLLPNTIFVNSSQGSPEFMVETFFHELLHLIFEQKEVVGAEDLEVRVDNAVVGILGDLLPHYVKQHIPQY